MKKLVCRNCWWYRMDTFEPDGFEQSGGCTRFGIGCIPDSPCQNNRKIVVTGGPCAGKTTVLERLKKAGYNIIPEVATSLLEGGYPPPNPWSQEWQNGFQKAIFNRQLEIEKDIEEDSIFDRGILDIAAYLEGGLDEFKSKYQVDPDELCRRYDTVIHLESLSTLNSNMYVEMFSTNPHRIEPLERAQSVEGRMQEVWSIHPNRHVISESSIDRIFDRVLQIIG